MKIKSFYLSKDIIKRVRMKQNKWKNIFSLNISNKAL